PVFGVVALYRARGLRAIAIALIFFPFLSSVDHVQFYNWWSLAFLPWLLYFIETFIEKRKLADAALAGMIAAFIFLGGQYKMVAYIYIVAMVWFVALAISSLTRRRSPPGDSVWLGVALAAVIFVGLTALQAYLIIDFRPDAMRWVNDPATGGVQIIP